MRRENRIAPGPITSRRHCDPASLCRTGQSLGRAGAGIHTLKPGGGDHHLPQADAAIVGRRLPVQQHGMACVPESCRQSLGESPVLEAAAAQRHARLADRRCHGHAAFHQRGMKSRAFKGARPSPMQERAITNFHRALRRFIEDPHADDNLQPERPVAVPEGE